LPAAIEAIKDVLTEPDVDPMRKLLALRVLNMIIKVNERNS
jgi:hypothetical protein